MSAPRPRFLALVLLVLAGLSALAGATPAPAREVTKDSGVVSIERHQGRLVRLAKPAASVFIANPAIADVSVKSARMVYVFAKAPGRTTLFAVDRSEQVIADLDIVVTHDLSGLRQALDSLLPASGVEVASVNGAIVLSGSVATGTQAEDARRLAGRFVGEGEEVINRLAVEEPNQVNIRVRIAEVQRRAMKEMGVNFDIFEGDFSFTSGDVFLNNPGALAGVGGFALSGGTFGVGSVLDTEIGGVGLNVLVEALEEMGMARTLAEPNLTALSGETASFLAGGEFPIPVSQDNDTFTIEFKQFGVSLAFTPTLIDKDRISLKVRPEVSQLSEAGAVTVAGLTIPALTTRRAETTVELGSGQSFAIAGLIQDDFQDTIRQLPYLSDVPIIGMLFRSEEFQRNETELVIVVTPYVVRPTSGNLPTPNDPFMAPGAEANAAAAAAADGPRIVPIPAASAAGAEQTGSAGYLLD